MVIMLVTYEGQVALNLMNFFYFVSSFNDSGHIFTVCKFHGRIANFQVNGIFVLLYYFFLFVAFGCNQSIREKKNALPLVTYTTLPTCQ